MDSLTSNNIYPSPLPVSSHLLPSPPSSFCLSPCLAQNQRQTTQNAKPVSGCMVNRPLSAPILLASSFSTQAEQLYFLQSCAPGCHWFSLCNSFLFPSLCVGRTSLHSWSFPQSRVPLVSLTKIAAVPDNPACITLFPLFSLLLCLCLLAPLLMLLSIVFLSSLLCSLFVILS